LQKLYPNNLPPWANFASHFNSPGTAKYARKTPKRHFATSGLYPHFEHQLIKIVKFQHVKPATIRLRQILRLFFLGAKA